MIGLKRFLVKYIFSIKPGMFRLFLASLVVMGHCIKVFIPFGPFAVYTFFILSGYWVAKMYTEVYLKKENPYLTFMFSRGLRLLPLYWLCTIILLVVVKFILPIYHITEIHKFGIFDTIGMILLVPLNFVSFRILGPAWSLAVEMQFYLIAPFMLLLIKKVNIYLIGFLLFMMSIYFTFFISLNIPLKINESVFPYLFYFFIGMIIYHSMIVVHSRYVIYSLLLAVFLITTCYVVPSFRIALLNKSLLYNSINLNAIFVFVLPFFFVPFIINNLQQKSDKMDRHYGDFSYTIYLVHAIVFKVYYSFFENTGFSSTKMLGLILTLMLVIFLSISIYFFFEKRVEIFRKALLNRI